MIISIQIDSVDIPSYYETKKQIEIIGQEVCAFEDQILLDKNLLGPISDQVVQYSQTITNTSFDLLELANKQLDQDKPQEKYLLTKLGQNVLRLGRFGLNYAKEFCVGVGEEGVNFSHQWKDFKGEPLTFAKEFLNGICSMCKLMSKAAYEAYATEYYSDVSVELRARGEYELADEIRLKTQNELQQTSLILEGFLDKIANSTAKDHGRWLTKIALFRFTPTGMTFESLNRLNKVLKEAKLGKGTSNVAQQTAKTATKNYAPKTVPTTTTNTVPTSASVKRKAGNVAAGEAGSATKKFAGEVGTEKLSDLYIKASYSNQHSKGARLQPKNLNEQLAMKSVLHDPSLGKELTDIQMIDPKWHMSDGWVKMSKNVNGIEIHYVRNKILNVFDDFKFK